MRRESLSGYAPPALTGNDGVRTRSQTALAEQARATWLPLGSDDAGPAGPTRDAREVNEPPRTRLAQRLAEDAGFDGERGRQAQSRVVSPRSVDSISSRVVA
jgi:hypothetical protein